MGVVKPVKEPVYLINPVLDGEVTNYYEWLPAGHYDISRARGAMHQIETIIKDIYYGFSMSDLFLQLATNYSLSSEEMKKFSFSVIVSAPVEMKAELSFSFEEERYYFKLYKINEQKEDELVKELESFGVGKIIEVGLPFSCLEAKPTQKVEFVVAVSKDGHEIERWPKGGEIAVAVPTESYSDEQWYV